MKTPLPTKPFHRLYLRYIEPHSTSPDIRRQEYILNILLCGLAIIAVIALLVSGTYRFIDRVASDDGSFISTFVFCLIVLGLVRLSRRGHVRAAAYIFIGILIVAATQLLLDWGFMLPEVVLSFSMIIVIAGVLLSSRAGLLVTAALSALMMIVSYEQINNRLHPDTGWQHEAFHVGDALGYVVIFCIIGLVAWLSNREIDRSLHRARASETALARERDSLELKVIERTRELEEAQLLRTMELERFAAFGRLSANLLHEVANPLTAASLNLDQFAGENSAAVRQARKNLQQLERYVNAARKQLKNHGNMTMFSVRRELQHITRILAPLARKHQIQLLIKQTANYKLLGDPVKFSQLVGNLILNAIDAYADLDRPPALKKIQVAITQQDQWLIITVTDWAKGITPAQLERLFEPFYTTKAHTSRGMGIGLSMVKQFVEQDFHGSITASSSTEDGTQFMAKLKLPKP